ncbi:MAG: tetratricopeptide repeat protein [Verrucomicrobiota bacterium]
MTGFALLLAAAVLAAPARWIFPDAPFRAVVKLDKPSAEPSAGIAINLPEFGNTTDKLLDVVMTDAAGEFLPVAQVWRGSGREVLLVAKELRADQEYYVYFGGARFRQGPMWQPQISLLMETRQVAAPRAIESWEKMDAVWRGAPEVDGAGWVANIYQGTNPFGNSRRFLSHYTGYLRTENMTKLTLYTLSSDASFVLVNGKYEFGWPGEHPSVANAKTVNSQAVSCAGPLTRIDYYQAKTAGNHPTMVLGWQKGDKLQTIPETAWVHPGTTKLVRIEQAQGWPVPAPLLKVRSYMGFADLWLYEVTGTLADELPAGWAVQWKFPDGSTKTQREFTRIVVGDDSLTVTVKLQKGVDELTGLRQVNFTEQIPAASVQNAGDMSRYLGAMAAENLSELAAATLRGYVAFLLAAEKDQAAGPLAEAWLKKNPDVNDALWLPAQVCRLRWLAQSDARAAVEELRRIPPAGRSKYTAPLDILELDFLVFYLNDAMAVPRALEISTRDPKSETARLALVRAGDYCRLQEKYPEAIKYYQQAQRAVVEGSAGRKLPAQDRAFSITIRDLLERGDVNIAEDKLQEWEAVHPVGKLASDFLILRGRVLMELGRWREALVEIESFEKLQAESPFQIDADFYRARALFELGKKDEARKIWSEIAMKYPQHALAERSRQWAGK